HAPTLARRATYSTRRSPLMADFDRDATKEALDMWGRFGPPRPGAGIPLSDLNQIVQAARWAVEVTEGDGIDELRERVARALHDSAPVSSPRTREDWDIHRAWYYGQADAVSRVVAEHLGGRDV